MPQNYNASSDSGSGLIGITWLLCVLTFIPFIGIAASFGMLFCAIRLVNSHSQVEKTHGWIAIGLWVFTFAIGFIVAFLAAAT